MRATEPTRFRQFWTMVVLSFLLTSTIYVWVPWLRKPLVRENNILELVTALLFLTVCILGIKHLVERGPFYHGKVSWGILFLGLLGFLEEISFGHSFLYYEVPVVNGVKIDALHDFLNVLVQLAAEMALSWSSIGLVFGACCLLLYAILRFRLYDYQFYAQQLRLYPPLKFVGLCLGFLAVAAVLDLEWLEHHYWVFLEEFLEAAASLALLFAYLMMSSLALKRREG